MIYLIYLGMFNIILAILIVAATEILGAYHKGSSKAKVRRSVKVSNIGQGVFLSSIVKYSEVQDA